MSGRAYWTSFIVVHTLATAGVASGLVVVWASEAMHTRLVWPGLLVTIWLTASNVGLMSYWRGVRDERRRTGAERYRIAWQQARERAQNNFDALVESDEECAALRAELRARDEAVR